MPRKLYKRVNRFEFFNLVNKNLRKRILWALSVKPGDLINDCSGFNVIVRSVEPDIWETPRGWLIHDVDLFVEPYGGTCSLRHCGVVPAKTVREIEKWFNNFYSKWNDGPYSDGGWHFKTEKDPVWMRLSQGLPICDDRGLNICGENHGQEIEQT